MALEPTHFSLPGIRKRVLLRIRNAGPTCSPTEFAALFVGAFGWAECSGEGPRVQLLPAVGWRSRLGLRPPPFARRAGIVVNGVRVSLYPRTRTAGCRSCSPRAFQEAGSGVHAAVTT